MSNNFVLIMAGGVGSRFWPVSIADFPKQFIDLLGTGKTLLQQTYERFLSIVEPENIFVVSRADYAQIINTQLPNLSNDNIILEPGKKNTAPAVLYGLHIIKRRNPNAAVLVTPVDHIVFSESKFKETMATAFNYIEKNDELLSIGIVPSSPDINYSYLQYLKDEPVADKLFRVKTFTENPTEELAKTFIQSGDFLWNSGIIAANLPSFFEAFSKHLPELYELFKEGEIHISTENEQNFIRQIYPMCENVSIKSGLIYKNTNTYVLVANFASSSLSNWESLWNNHNKDYVGNVVTGTDVKMYDSSNCIVKAPTGKLVIVSGLDDFIIVDNGQTLLICPRAKEDEIKEYLVDVKRTNGEKYH